MLYLLKDASNRYAIYDDGDPENQNKYRYTWWVISIETVFSAALGSCHFTLQSILSENNATIIAAASTHQQFYTDYPEFFI